MLHQVASPVYLHIYTCRIAVAIVFRKKVYVTECFLKRNETFSFHRRIVKVEKHFENFSHRSSQGESDTRGHTSPPADSAVQPRQAIWCSVHLAMNSVFRFRIGCEVRLT